MSLIKISPHAIAYVLSIISNASYFNSNMYTYVCLCVDEHEYPWRPEEGIRSGRAEIAGFCEQLTWVLETTLRAVCALT